MSSYYDNELVSHMKTIKIGDVTIISQIDNITELMMENFQFKNGRVCFTEKQEIPRKTRCFPRDYFAF